MPETLYPFHLADLVRDSAYSLTQFTDVEKDAFLSLVFFKEAKGKSVPYV